MKSKDFHHRKYWQVMLKSSAYTTTGKDNPLFFSGQERSHERNGYLEYFMIRNNDLAGLGNGNSEQTTLLEEKFKGRQRCVFIKLLSLSCNLPFCALLGDQGSDPENQISSLPAGIFKVWLMRLEGDEGGREKAFFFFCFSFLLFLVYGIYPSSGWFQFPEFFLHSENSLRGYLHQLAIAPPR